MIEESRLTSIQIEYLCDVFKASAQIGIEELKSLKIDYNELDEELYVWRSENGYLTNIVINNDGSLVYSRIGNEINEVIFWDNDPIEFVWLMVKFFDNDN